MFIFSPPTTVFSRAFLLRQCLTFFFFFAAFTLSDFCFGILSGRIPEKTEYDQWVFKEDKEKRTLAFTSFEALQKNKDDKEVEILSTTLPQTIAMMMKHGYLIDVQEGDFSEKRVEEGAYQIIHFPYEEKEITKNGKKIIQKVVIPPKDENVPLDPIKINTSKVDYYEKKQNDALKKYPDIKKSPNFAFVKTNEKEKKFSVYLYQKERERYIDTQNFSKWQVKTLKASRVNLQKNKDSDHHYLQTSKKTEKKLLIDENLYKLKDAASINSLFRDENVDYYIYGTYKKLSQKKLLMSLFFIYPKKKWITHILSKKVNLVSLQKDLQDVPTMILAFIQGKEIVENVYFFGEADKDALLYLNEHFVGNLPLKINTLTEGEYSLRVWHPKKIFFVREGNAKKSTKNNDKQQKKTLFTIDQSHKKFDLGYELRDYFYGNLDIKIINNVPAQFYIEGKLAKENATNYKDSLPVGEYFLKVESKDHDTLFFELPIKKNATTQLHFPLSKEPQLPLWKKRLFDHDQNARIFAALGLVMSGASIVSYIDTLHIEDLKHAAELKREGEYFNNAAGLDQYINDLSEQYSISLAISASLFFGGALPCLLISTISYALNVHLEQTKIHTMYDSKGFGLNIKIKE